MLVAILLILVILWLLGYGPFQVLALPLITINGRLITVWDVLIFLVLLWLVGALPSPIRQIAGVIILLWVLSVLGIFAIAGLSNILVIAIIAGLLLYVLSEI